MVYYIKFNRQQDSNVQIQNSTTYSGELCDDNIVICVPSSEVMSHQNTLVPQIVKGIHSENGLIDGDVIIDYWSNEVSQSNSQFSRYISATLLKFLYPNCSKSSLWILALVTT